MQSLFGNKRILHTIATTLFVMLLTLIACAPLLAAAQSEPLPLPPGAEPELSPGAGGNTDVTPRNGKIDPLAQLGATAGNFILYIGSFFLGFGGLLLDMSINKFILGLGGIIGTGSPIGTAINNSWVLVRDVCNLAFIFGFIYIGLRTIIDADSSNTKRMLASIIIGAVLINFSLFISKAVIEVSNRVSTEIYKTMVGETGSSIATRFEHEMGLSTIYATAQNAKDAASRTAGGNIAFYFMGTLFFIIAGFVFAAGAVLLMVRFVILIFILCFSPILFAATVFPATKAHAENLWHKLISYSFFAPVYLFLLVISLNILSKIMITMRGNGDTFGKSLQGIGDTSGSVVQATDAYTVFLTFGVAILFLILSLQIASKFGIAGADRAVGMMNTARSWGQRKLTNTAMWAPRKAGQIAVGKTSKAALKSFDKWQAKAPNGVTGKAARWTLEKTNLDRSLRGTLESGKKAKFGLENSYQDNLDYADERKKRTAKNLEQQKFDKNFEKENLALLQKKGDLSPEEEQKKIALERATADASTKQLEELEHEQRLAIVALMTQSQIDALNKSDNLTDVEKRELGEKRAEIIKAKFGNNATGSTDEENTELRKQRDGLGKANIDQLSVLGVDFLKDEKHAVRLTNSQMDDLKKKLTLTEYSRIDEARQKALKKLAEENANIDGKTAQNHILKMKASDMSKLPKDVLFALAPSLPTSTLAEIAKQNTLNAEDQRKIREDIETVIKEGSTGNYRITDIDKKQLESIEDFLKTNPYGKQFGR